LGAVIAASIIVQLSFHSLELISAELRGFPA
jgi:hypothetical protein